MKEHLIIIKEPRYYFFSHHSLDLEKIVLRRWVQTDWIVGIYEMSP